MTLHMTTEEGHKEHPITRSDRLRIARERMPGSPDRKTFAEMTGLGRNTIAKYEDWQFTHHRKPLVMAWATATGTDFEWLWSGRSGGGKEGWAPWGSNSRPLDSGLVRRAA